MSDEPIGANRRAAIRYPASFVSCITGVRLSPGEPGTLINISTSGLLLESAVRYTPGSSVTAHFEGDIATQQIRGRVVRCEVSAIKAGALNYRTGLAFGKLLTLPFETAAIDAAPAGASAVTTSEPLVNRW